MDLSIFGIGNNTPKVEYKAVKNTILGDRVVSGTLSADEYLKKANEAVYGRSRSIFNMANIAGGTLGALNNLSNQDAILTVYDQNSINETMWAKADSDNNGYVDDKELMELYGSFVTANDGFNISGNTVALAALGAASALFQQNDKYTPEQSAEINNYYLADKELDTNNDGVLNRDEFEGAAINYILTPQNKPQKEEQG